MNWLRHELRYGALGLQFNSWSAISARNHDAIASIHDGNAVKSFKSEDLQ